MKHKNAITQTSFLYNYTTRKADNYYFKDYGCVALISRPSQRLYPRVGGVIAAKGINFGDKSKLRCVAGPIAFNGTFYHDRGFCAQNFANGDSASFHYEAKGKLGGGITERSW